jgi:hypothetical protein
MFAYTTLRRVALALRAVEVALSRAKERISNTAEATAATAKLSGIKSLEKRVVRAIDDVESAGLRLDNAQARFEAAREDLGLTADEVRAESIVILNEVL